LMSSSPRIFVTIHRPMVSISGAIIWAKTWKDHAGDLRKKDGVQPMVGTPDWVDKSRRSIPYFGVSRREHPVIGHLMASMFADDIQLGHLSVQRREEGFDVVLDPAGPNSEREVLHLLGEFDTGWRGSLENTVP